MLLLEHVFGLSFMLLALVSTTCYHGHLKSWRLAVFYERLRDMQSRWGRPAGTILHIFAYVLTPIFFGLTFLLGLVFQS
jgi:hypothetical protein